MKKLNLTVKGMTCSSCEVLIERGLKKVPGVERVSVNRAQERADVECEDTVQLSQLQDAVRDKGYQLSLPEGTLKKSFLNQNNDHLMEIGAMFLCMMGLYLLFKQLNFLPNIGVSDTMSYGFIFVIGLVAAMSTCLAVAGGLLLAIAEKYNEKYPNLQGWQKFKPHFSFNVGRIVSYTILGGLIGLLGSTLAITPKVTGIITIAASVVMIIMGIQLLHIFPWLNRIQIKMPKFIAHRLYENNSTPSTSRSFLFGAATFFLPCGFTQALQLYVLGTGNFMVGALTMLAFSLGTLPSLAGIGAISSFSKGDFKRYVSIFSAILIVILGVYNIPSGLTLVGASVVDTENSIAADIQAGAQIVNMQVRGIDYYPSAFTIKKGIPVQWNIDGRQAQGCARVISAPSLGITQRLSSNDVTTIEFTPEKEGTIPFTCTMGMAGPGKFTVVP